MSSFPENPDVIVVGAGTAGLSAAKTLLQQGRSVVVLEAAPHVGGRCITDTLAFTTPFDRGGSWLHSASINPLAKLAEEHGFELNKEGWLWEHAVCDGHRLSRSEIDEYREYQQAMWEQVDKVGAGNTDVPVQSTLPESQWRPMAKHWVAQMLGGDADVTSAMDSARYEDADGDWLVVGGLGAFVKALHKDVQVALECPVSRIDHRGSRVIVTTPRGTLSAPFLIITVSTGVLSSGRITFDPPLGDRKSSAIEDLPNGLLNKVGIEFDPYWKEFQEVFTADYLTGQDEFCTLLFGFYNTNLSVGFVAGRFADQLENEGEGAATAFCLEALRSVFGNDTSKKVLKTSETAWRRNQLTQGSYSHARPGCADARKVLAQPIDERIYFAGEATVENAFATVHGAYLSGKIAAQNIIDRANKAN